MDSSKSCYEAGIKLSSFSAYWSRPANGGFQPNAAYLDTKGSTWCCAAKTIPIFLASSLFGRVGVVGFEPAPSSSSFIPSHAGRTWELSWCVCLSAGTSIELQVPGKVGRRCSRLRGLTMATFALVTGAPPTLPRAIRGPGLAGQRNAYPPCWAPAVWVQLALLVQPGHLKQPAHRSPR